MQAGFLGDRGKVLANIEPPLELLIEGGFVKQVVLDGEFQIFFEKLSQHIFAVLDHQVEKRNRQKDVLVFRFLYDDLRENQGRHIFPVLASITETWRPPFMSAQTCSRVI